MSQLPVMLVLLVLALVITAGVYDWRYRRVPNWLVLAGLVAGIGANITVFGLAGLFVALKGAGLALLIYFPLYLLRAMGAGDAKLMAAVGALTGPMNWLGIFIVTGILGGVVAVVVLTAKSRLHRTFQNMWLILATLANRQAPYAVSPELDVKSGAGFRMPHAVVIMAGTIIFLVLSAAYGRR